MTQSIEDGRSARPVHPGDARKEMKRPSMQIALGMVLGAGVGTALGVAAGHVAAWLGIGITIGVVIGSNFRSTNCAECTEVHEKHHARSQQPEANG